MSNTSSGGIVFEAEAQLRGSPSQGGAVSRTLRHFRVRYEMGPERIDIAVTETSAIRAMENVLREKHGFTDRDTVRDFCAKVGCTVSADPLDDPAVAEPVHPNAHALVSVAITAIHDAVLAQGVDGLVINGPVNWPPWFEMGYRTADFDLVRGERTVRVCVPACPVDVLKRPALGQPRILVGPDRSSFTFDRAVGLIAEELRNHRTPGFTACSDPKCSVVIQHDAHPPGRWPGFEDAMRTAFDRPFVIEYKGKRPNAADAARVSPEDRAAVEAQSSIIDQPRMFEREGDVWARTSTGTEVKLTSGVAQVSAISGTDKPRPFGLRAPGCYRLYFNRHGVVPLVWCVAPDGGGWELAVKSVEITAPCATVYTPKPAADDEDGQPSAWIRVEGVLTVDADGHATVGPA